MKPTIRFFALLTLILVTSSSLAPLIACGFCKPSPNGFGFCRWGYEKGYAYCEEYVMNAWTGQTWCHEDRACYNGGDTDPKFPLPVLTYANATTPPDYLICAWANVDTNAIVVF